VKPVDFPTTFGSILRTNKGPRLSLRKGKRGKPDIRGTRISKYGMTLEERYAGMAPEGTNPERLMYGWLMKHGFLFTYQEPIGGGRIPGGAVIDFTVYDKVPPLAIRIMSYWHESAEAKWADDVQAWMLMENGFTVEDVWEWEITTLDKLDRKMQEIMFGAPKFSSASMPAISTSGERCPVCGDPNCVRVDHA